MKSIIFCCILATFSFSSIYGQVSSAEQAVKKAEKKVADKMIEKTFNGLVNKLFGSDSTKTTENTSVRTDSTVTSNSSPFGGLFSSKTVDKEFKFDMTLDMEMVTKDKKGKGDVIYVKAHYSQDSAYIGTEMENIFNIMDFGDKKNYALMGGKVTIMNLESFIDKANKKAKKKEENEEIPEFTKTGKTEMVAGYKCDEYLVEDEDFTGHYYIANGIGLNPEVYAKTFDANPAINYPKDQRGVILKMVIENTKDKTTTTMITKEVIKQELNYDLSKYKATDLSKLF
ncbi:DUF4412 domain-containing protein [Portibacter lacus]|uniref:DUF4412 domain-containing protein n=1 Tax=Portibacter lacus TaxID=1099794 RepID=A0AA37SQK6_9BACT|nr:DUF4412 domain-containing protein [Portibacter lacus]GLR15845.1 hypothetical protein GCM10007940_04600 [Portibacter lacus]